MLLLIAILTFITLLVIGLLCYNYMIANRYTISSRMEQYVEKQPQEQVALTPIISHASSQSSRWHLLIKNMSKHF